MAPVGPCGWPPPPSTCVLAAGSTTARSGRPVKERRANRRTGSKEESSDVVARTRDPAAILGLIGVVGALAVAIFLGGRPAAFVDLPSMLIVLAGTVAATTMTFSSRELLRVPAIVWTALSPGGAAPSRRVALEGIAIAELARREEIRAMEKHQQALTHRPVLQRGLAMALEGRSPALIERALRRQIAADDERRARAEAILRRAADVAPAMGLIGTLIGLVQMLGQLDDPSSIGPAMAVALLTTFYGALLAHALFYPLAERLAGQADHARLQAELQLLAALSIAERENPRLLEASLNSLLEERDQLEEYA